MTAPLADDLADGGGQALDRAGLVRGQRLLHLHRLEHHDQVAGRDRVPVGRPRSSRWCPASGWSARRRRPPRRRPGTGTASAPRPARPRRPPRRARPAGSPPAAGRRPRPPRSPAASGSSPSSAAAPDHGASPPAQSVSIHRVCTRNGSSVKSASRTTARWNGSTVGSPSTTVSSSARRDRSSASARVAPVTISLASSESKAPPTTAPGSTPESTRTPGPAGSTYVGHRARARAGSRGPGPRR